MIRAARGPEKIVDNIPTGLYDSGVKSGAGAATRVPELGWVVVDELIGPLLKARWLGAIENSTNPVGDLKWAFRHSFKKTSARLLGFKAVR